jgi:N-acetylglucosamine-6-sulfatase
MSWRHLLAALAAALLLGVAAGDAHAQKPNFVFVLTDDLASDLVPFMPNVQVMQREGTSFDRYFVTDSLCCPSRASILTGRYPHSTRVLTNTPPDGGFEVFHRAAERSTFATSLQAAGYRTALMGKYLNGYAPLERVDGARHYVPPGWSAWATGGNAYRDYGYNLLVKDPGLAPPRLVRYGDRAQDYLTDVISRRGRAFIAGAVRARKPFMLELSTYAPHSPYTPAVRDYDKFPDMQAPRGPLFDEPQLDGAPAWLSTVPLSESQIYAIDRDFRLRAMAVQSIDKLVGDIRVLLRALGVANNTYVVFTSDNGFHQGQRRLLPGKQTYFDHDIRVPLVVVGPGVPPGARIGHVAANVDLRPTFQQLAGLPIEPRVEGRSLAPFLRGRPPARWRRFTLIEHRGPNFGPGDPDAQNPRHANPPSYAALRFGDALYVQYRNRAYAPEYYDLASDPLQQRNVYASLSPEYKAQLAARLEEMRTCRGTASCHDADA